MLSALQVLQDTEDVQVVKRKQPRQEMHGEGWGISKLVC